MPATAFITEPTSRAIVAPDGTPGILRTHGPNSAALFSPCGLYRYELLRLWSAPYTSTHQGELLTVIGLNPSTTDERQDDNTIRRCIRFARDWGYSGLRMLNAFAYRATDPKVMKAQHDPNGPGNDGVFRALAGREGLIIAAWGVHCPDERQARVCEMIGRDIHSLGKTKEGKPKHPLYLAKTTMPELFWQAKGKV